MSLGGTIASVGEGPVAPGLGAADLAAGIDDLAATLEIEPLDARRVPSVELTLEDLYELASRVRERRGAGELGIVVTQGTDTLEEAAFALELLGAAPLVVTGSMRPPGAPGADGPANLRAALRVASDPATRDLGVLVVMNDEIHAARFVRKVHTASPAAFASPVAGALGDVVEGRVRLRTRVRALAALEARPPYPAVPLVSIGFDDDGMALGALADLEPFGLVLEGVGGAHVPARLVETIGRIAARSPVVLASRTGAGPVLERSYGYPGGEVDLLGRGLISAGSLDARHARVALRLLLAAGVSREGIARWFGDLDGSNAPRARGYD